MEEVKTCTCCGIEKPISQFHKHKLKKDGYANKCKDCIKAYTTIYYEKHKEKLVKYRTDYNRNNPRKAYRSLDARFHQLLKTAAYRNKFEVCLVVEDLKELWQKQEGRCAYTKLPLLATANQFNTVSLDRIDSGKGYIVGNVQFVCAAVNKMKQNYTEDLFVLLSLLVTQNNKLSESPESLLARYFPLGTSDSNAPDKVSLCSGVERI